MFTDHYSPSALCAPARAGFLTGRFNHRTGAVDVPSNRGLDRLDLTEKTFGDYFHHAGYETALIGKWHNGAYSDDYLPHRRGFDLFFGFPNGGQDYWKWNLLRNNDGVPHDGRYLSDALNDEAITFIRNQNEKPFALWLAHHAPHSPLQSPEALVQKYEKRLGKDVAKAAAITYAMIEAMDTGLARVFQTLRDEGLWEKTIIVFTSDNGLVLRRDAELGSQMRFNGFFSDEKESVLEGGLRVPAIVAWPGHIPRGRVESTPVHGCDWLPTLYSLTGESVPAGAKPFDGLNLMPLLEGKPAPAVAGRFLPFQRNRYAPVRHVNASIREGGWKLYWPGDVASSSSHCPRGPIDVDICCPGRVAHHVASFSWSDSLFKKPLVPIIERSPTVRNYPICAILMVIAFATHTILATDYPDQTDEPQKAGWPLSDEELVYILRAEHDRRPGRESNKHLPAMWPVVPSAGNWGGTSWLDTHARLVEYVKANAGPCDALLVGDSLTIQWGDSWKKHFPDLKAINIGIGGDKTQNVLWRLDHGGVDGLQPKLILLMIGNNNMFFTPETGIEPASKGIESCVKNLRGKFPAIPIIVAKILPAHKPGSRFYEDIQKTNAALDLLNLEREQNVFVLDLWNDFTNGNGTIRKDLFTADSIHLSPAGYAAYAKRLEPMIDAIFNGKPLP